MNAIIAFSISSRTRPSSEKAQRISDHITTAGDSLLRLIDDIIDIAKLEAKQLKISIGPANAADMLRELKKFSKIKSEK
jgi:signal transduction histidine kinase